jgi:hypothetical protein
MKSTSWRVGGRHGVQDLRQLMLPSFFYNLMFASSHYPPFRCRIHLVQCSQ